MSEKRNPEDYAKVRKRIKCVETGEIFISVTDAARKINRAVNTVSAALTNSKSAGGYHFEYCRKES